MPNPFTSERADMSLKTIRALLVVAALALLAWFYYSLLPRGAGARDMMSFKGGSTW